MAKAIDTKGLSTKPLLSVREAAAYSHIGINRLYALTNEDDCPFVVRCGKRRLVHRELFDVFLRESAGKRTL